MVKINGVVFVHGGLTPEVAELGCAQVNDTVRREITRDIDKTRLEPATSLAAGESGPLWYAGTGSRTRRPSSPRRTRAGSCWTRARSWWATR